MTESKYHQLCRDYMCKFDFPQESLDEWLEANKNKLNESEQYVAKSILSLEEYDFTEELQITIGWQFSDERMDNKMVLEFFETQMGLVCKKLNYYLKQDDIKYLTNSDSNFPMILAYCESDEGADDLCSRIKNRLSSLDCYKYLTVAVELY